MNKKYHHFIVITLWCLFFPAKAWILLFLNTLPIYRLWLSWEWGGGLLLIIGEGNVDPFWLNLLIKNPFLMKSICFYFLMPGWYSTKLVLLWRFNYNFPLFYGYNSIYSVWIDLSLLLVSCFLLVSDDW